MKITVDSEFNENLSSYKFVIRTVQASAFRTLIEALILTDVNIEIDETGMKLLLWILLM